MKGDFSRDVFAPARHYDAVLLEQGGLVTDSDWKEQGDIARHLRERAVGDIVGDCGAPLATAAFGLTAGYRARAIAVDNASPPVLWIAGEDGFLLRSADQGTTWTVLDTGTTAHLNALGLRGGTLWAVGEQGTVLSSGDAGATWKTHDPGTKATLRAVGFSGANRICAVADGGLVIVSDDAGNHWTRSAATAVQLNGIAFQGVIGIVVGDGGTVCTTQDGGNTWQVRTSGTTHSLRAVAFVDASNAWAVGDGGVILHSADSGATWSSQTSGSNEALLALSFSSAAEGVAAGMSGALLSTADGGVTWTALPGGVTTSLGAVQIVAGNALAASDGGELVHVPLGGGAPTLTGLPPVGLQLGAGRYYVKGTLCEVEAPVSYFNQPDRGPVPRLAPGQHLIFVQAWRRHLCALEAEGIREVALGDADPSSRSKLVWQVRAQPIEPTSPPLASCEVDSPEWLELTAAPTARLSARSEPGQPAANLCDVGSSGGYRRLENQLYRVEIHEGGAQPTFKWSRENGSVAFGIASIAEPSGTSPVTTVVRLQSRGRDGTLDIAAGDRVEILNDDLVLEGRAGPLFEVVGDGDDEMEIVLSGAVPASLAADRSRHPLLRRWDHGASGELAVAIAEGQWIELEEGVQIRFEPNGVYRPGDFWTIPARAVVNDVEWPRDASNVPVPLPASGIEDRFCKLGVVDVAADGSISVLSDCRNLFPPLTALTNLFYVGGDGQEVAADPLDPQPVALPSPLRVAVFNGQYPVSGAQVLFTVAHGLLPNGSNVEVVRTGSDGVAAVDWRLDPAVAVQTASAQLLLAGAPAADRYNVIHFTARLSVASRVAYDPSNCADLLALNVTNVQSAIDALCARTHQGAGGCCVTVGEKGEFRTLDEAITKLIAQDRRDICICLLPGRHQLRDSIDVRQAGLKLSIHGAGRATQLLVVDQALNFMDLAALQVRDLDVLWPRVGPSAMRLVRCREVELSSVGLAGITRRGFSLLQIGGATRIDLTACRILAYLDESLNRGRMLLDRVSTLAFLAPSMEPNEEGMLAPLPLKMGEAAAGLAAATRKKMGTELKRLVADQSLDPPLTPEESDAIATLQAAIAAPDAHSLHLSLEALRGAVLLNTLGSALSIEDAEAMTLISDCRIDGRVSLYGECGRKEGESHEFRGLSEMMHAGKVMLGRGRGDMRMRNNRLRELRLGDVQLRRIRELMETGGTLTGCYRSFVFDSNELVGPESQWLAFDLALGSNLFQPFTDVGTTISTQLKLIGNFAHNDFRLFFVGSPVEQFGNGGLNPVAG
jgi:photosystem II stability/assembly factor-like uncharacterized protein